MDDRIETAVSQNKDDISMNVIVLKIFEKDNFLLFVYKKVERIVSASYLLSSFLSDKEPIKWQFRDGGVSILSRVLSLKASPFSKSVAMSEVASDLLKLLSLLNISFTAGFVSEMNFNILKKELESLIETLHFKSNIMPQDGGKKLELDKEFFALSHASFFPKDNGDSLQKSPLADTEEEIPKDVAETWSDIIRRAGAHKRHVKGQIIKDKKLSDALSPTAILSNSKGQGIKNNSNTG